ncbi:MAG: amidohydrolase family protein, partial [Rhodospirillales bacterium]|nr:amidohydrolase family protein [Rhodospirillales bacterium]
MAAISAGSPMRPTGDCTFGVGRAPAEAGRAVRELGCRGVSLGTNVRGRDLDDPAFLPVFETVAALGVPVFLHPI